MNFPKAAITCRAAALLEKLNVGALIEERNEKGRTALFLAARVGRLENVILLLGHGADPNAKDNTDEAPLQAAARYGHLECVQALVKAGARINDCPAPEKAFYSETALCSSVRKKFPEIAQFLLGAGADPNAASTSNRFPLHEAVGNGDLTLLRSLVAAGADHRISNDWWGTPLHLAVARSEIEIIRELLKLGADVNARNIDGRTPLMLAVLASKNDVQLTFEVLKGNPNLSLLDSENASALDLALWREEVLREKYEQLIQVAPNVKLSSFYLSNEKQQQLIENTLVEALWREKTEVVEILRMVATPGRKINGNSRSDPVLSISQETKIDLQLIDPHVPFSKKDEEIAAELPIFPNLVQYLGWRASKAHWRLLEGSQWAFKQGVRTAYSIDRLAYFARGYRNRPAGTELDDGPRLLGEPYEKAIERFLNEGLLCIEEPRNTLLAVTTVTILKGIAASSGIKVRSKKVEILDELLAKCGVFPFREILERNRLYVLTELGRREFENKAAHLSDASKRLNREIIDAFSDGALILGLILVQNLRAIHDIFKPLSLRSIYMARLILENTLPIEIILQESDLSLIRAISAFKTIYYSADDVWPKELKERPPTMEVKVDEAKFPAHELTPSQFGKMLIKGEIWGESLGHIRIPIEE